MSIIIIRGLQKQFSKIGHKSLSYQGSKLWIKLPLCLKNISHLGKFQDKLESYLLNSDSKGH